MQNATKHPLLSGPNRLAYSVNDFCRVVGIGRTLTYSLIGEGKIRTIRIAGRRLIPASEAQRLVEQSAT